MVFPNDPIGNFHFVRQWSQLFANFAWNPIRVPTKIYRHDFITSFKVSIPHMLIVMRCLNGLLHACIPAMNVLQDPAHIFQTPVREFLHKCFKFCKNLAQARDMSVFFQLSCIFRTYKQETCKKGMQDIFQYSSFVQDFVQDSVQS